MSITSIALVSGEGTNIFNNPALITRAKRKVITRAMILALIDVVKEKGETEREQTYWNAYHCQNYVTISGNKLYGNYCKNRFCTICCAIRKTDLINRYYPTISKWKDIHFVTLTVKSINALSLNDWIWGMFKQY